GLYFPNIPIGPWSVGEAVRRATPQLPANDVNPLLFAAARETRDDLNHAIPPILNLLLYICSESAEIGRSEQRPVRAEAVRTKRGARFFPAEKISVWDVGLRLGARLRTASAPSVPQGGTHAAPRPHIRRAHWHGYWTGPRTSGAERSFHYKWMPPIPVNL